MILFSSKQKQLTVTSVYVIVIYYPLLHTKMSAFSINYVPVICLYLFFIHFGLKVEKQ